MNINPNISMPQIVALPSDAEAVGKAKSPEPRTADPASATGVADLARVAGEEPVDERALRRDDALGKLVEKAFNLPAPPWITDNG